MFNFHQKLQLKKNVVYMHMMSGKRKMICKQKNAEINKEGRFIVHDKITTENRVAFYGEKGMRTRLSDFTN